MTNLAFRTALFRIFVVTIIFCSIIIPSVLFFVFRFPVSELHEITIAFHLVSVIAVIACIVIVVLDLQDLVRQIKKHLL